MGNADLFLHFIQIVNNFLDINLNLIGNIGRNFLSFILDIFQTESRIGILNQIVDHFQFHLDHSHENFILSQEIDLILIALSEKFVQMVHFQFRLKVARFVFRVFSNYGEQEYIVITNISQDSRFVRFIDEIINEEGTLEDAI